MATLNEQQHNFEGVLEEFLNGSGCYEEKTVEGTDLAPMTVLGMITVGGNYAIHDPAETDGTETAAGILMRPLDNASGEAALVLTSQARVAQGALQWITGISGPQIATAIGHLATLDIRVSNNTV